MESNMLFKFVSIRLCVMVLFIGLSGCIPQAQSEKSISAPSSENIQKWTVLLSISGGFAGWMKNISIDSSGTLIINDIKRNKSIRNKVNNNELGALYNLLVDIKDLKSEHQSTKFTNTCADCFNYELSIRSHNRQLLVTLNDINLSKSGFRHVVIFLRKMVTKYEK